MAVTKIHAVKATVSGAVAYICNGGKTDGRLYVSAYATSPETAADDFRFTLSHTDRSDPNKAYHLIQSFAPGETDAGQAHGIGVELADRLLKGRYSYVISTHTDRGHIHNHIIFCAADNVEYKKYHDCKRTYWEIRHISDELCAERGLSVPHKNRQGTQKYNEWQNAPDRTSWKSKLKEDINETIRQSRTYDEFISIMLRKGYEVKDSGTDGDPHKYIAFRAPGQQRWVRGRAKSLGVNYTRERIRERIEDKARLRTERMTGNGGRTPSMIDTSQEKFAGSPGLKRWADLQNLKTAARLQSKLAETGFDSIRAIDDRIGALHLQAKTDKRTTIALDREIKKSAEILRYARQYSEKGKYARNYRKSKAPERYYQTHSYDLHLAWGAAEVLENSGINPDRMDLREIASHYEGLCNDRKAASDSYKRAERECERLRNAKGQLMGFIGREPKTDKERDRGQVRD